MDGSDFALRVENHCIAKVSFPGFLIPRVYLFARKPEPNHLSLCEDFPREVIRGRGGILPSLAAAQ